MSWPRWCLIGAGVPNYAQMILELRVVGITARSIALWGRSKGREFTHHAIQEIVKHERQNPRAHIALTIKEMHDLMVQKVSR